MHGSLGHSLRRLAEDNAAVTSEPRAIPWRCKKCNGILAWVWDEEARAQGADVVLRKDGKAAIHCPFCRELNVWIRLDSKVSNRL